MVATSAAAMAAPSPATATNPSASAGVGLTLAPAGAPVDGFIPARLAVADPQGRLTGVVRAVAIRPEAGGPTILCPASIAPKTVQDLPVRLPVISAQQAFVVRLLPAADAAATPLHQAIVPLEVTDLNAVEQARNALIDSHSYDGRLEDLPRWPPALLRTVFLAAVLACVALGGALFIRRPAIRLLAAAAVVAAGSFVLAHVLGDCPDVLVRPAGAVTIVTCRRTANWSHPSDMLPVYWNQRTMERDDLILRPEGDLTVTLHPGDVRVFRRTEGTGQGTASTSPARP
jgi:hypothetical protein